MRSLPFCQYDAFTLTSFEGNACAIIYDADDLSAPVTQALALEMNLSETSFVMGSEVADFRFRYFTPAEEIPLAGHPTIATVASLVEAGRLTLEGDSTAIRVELTAGVIEVEVISEDGAPPTIVMKQKKPEFFRTYDAADVMPAFGLTPDDSLAGVPIRTVSTGTPQLMIPLHGHEALRRTHLDIPRYRDLRDAGDFFSPHLFCLGGVHRGGRYQRPPLRATARHAGRPVHRVRHGRYGCVPLALWPNRIAEFCGGAGPLDGTAGPRERECRRSTRPHRGGPHRRQGGEGD